VRNAFVAELTSLAAADERIVLLTGDLGFMVLEDFQSRFPDRFVNCGAAEQNMVGVATGLAEAGMVPFVYSIATFSTLRPYEFIRNGPALHGLPVRIVGIGGGFEYGQNGVTHFALEDYALMRAQPAIATIAPADAAQAGAALRASADLERPIYFRIGKRDDPLPGLDGRFELGRADVLREGADAAIVTIGAIAHEALAAAEILAGRGLEVAVALVSSFNPSPVEDLAALLAERPLAMTLEAHYRDGGLGSLVAETIAENGLRCRLLRAGVERMPDGETGSQGYLEKLHGLDGSHLADRLLKAVEREEVPSRR
jgi:transketolase